jgi:hypothetical protein
MPWPLVSRPVPDGSTLKMAVNGTSVARSSPLSSRVASATHPVFRKCSIRHLRVPSLTRHGQNREEGIEQKQAKIAKGLQSFHAQPRPAAHGMTERIRRRLKRRHPAPSAGIDSEATTAQSLAQNVPVPLLRSLFPIRRWRNLMSGAIFRTDTVIIAVLLPRTEPSIALSF